MRIAVVSDIHGNLPALEAVVADIARRGVDAVVNLGDCFSGPLLPRETAGYLMTRDWLQIAGNHERQVLNLRPGRGSPEDEYAAACLGEAERAWMTALPATARLGDEVFLCHGIPDNDLIYFLESVDPAGVRAATAAEVEVRLGAVAAPVVLCGHSHTPRAVRSRRGSLIVNPGSVGLQAYDDGYPHPHRIENRSPDARYALVERTHGGWVASLIAVPYDAAPMAELARRRGMLDWVQPLLSGYME